MKSINPKSKKGSKVNHIKVVDLFAGPGGLGEGFSSVDAFRIAVSVEMESSAHATLRMRAFYRILLRHGKKALKPYYDYCNMVDPPRSEQLPLGNWDELTRQAWNDAGEEAQQLTLGNPEHNKKLDRILVERGIATNVPWVLIGGPPCQAYSLVGRARNKGKEEYNPEDDHRHFLYKEYLRIIQKYRPHIFVMENVKGILSSKIGGQKIFHSILRDLSDPDTAQGKKGSRYSGYTLHSLSTDTSFGRVDDPEQFDARNFIIRADDFGVPQARHRVILVGVRDDIANLASSAPKKFLLKKNKAPSVKQVIKDLPKVRSKLSKEKDSAAGWRELIVGFARELATAARKSSDYHDLVEELTTVQSKISDRLPTGSNRSMFRRSNNKIDCPAELQDWYLNSPALGLLEVHLNHEARGHMASDLRRYLFAAVHAKEKGYSPKGHSGFSLPRLRPDHNNWESGKFSDRFRVQLSNEPATTVTSHIAKDGHYFIHYDPTQCRSLTVREAARLQTFPDDYFFQGNRTQQYHQVGNAVPPYLAHQVAKLIEALFDKV
jgi:DNA (cytosine-5)-methyltransferase 1